MSNIFGYNPKGFLYIEQRGNVLITVQVNHSPSQLAEWFSTLPKFENYETAKYAYFITHREVMEAENRRMEDEIT